ncbi:replication protein A 70 kDa DNA-binding subunit-like [Phymastichus coffea]|uniref:replication protein A 70 kDa DNA-binding subunit-like n=1 Tax=Phymastichus coffea TaxID=108790 RepID=UPI00273BF661|nr:replication protein A 70 kDa DNA-binding subunit-like [Phymastichus coffea]
MLPELTKGALDRIMSGEEVEEPIFQVLGHKRLASSTSGERYRLLVSDGIKSNSFTMLATQLNQLVTNDVLSEHSIVQIKRYAISMVNNGGTQRRVMVILNIDVLVPGNEVGKVLGSISVDNTRTEEAGSNTALQASAAPQSKPVINNQVALKTAPRANNTSNNLNESISGSGGISTTPIAALSPYHNRWVIKARVTNKSNIRTWSNSRGEGKLFHMDLLDESGEIRCTAFREQCDKFYDMIEIGKVYFITRGVLKPANKQFNNLKNDYEMTIGNDTEIAACNEESQEIPEVQFNFVSISSIEHKQKDELIDVLGIVKFCSDVQSLTARTTGRELKKRDLSIVDENNDLINLTLWGQQAIEFNGDNNPVVAMKGVKIGEFQGGKNLSIVASSLFQVDPDLPQAHKLRGWFKTVGASEESRSISKVSADGGSMNGPWSTFKEAEEQRFGHADQPNQFITKATVNLIRSENALYKACPTEGCKKKVVDQSNGMYKCEKCQRDYPNFTYRLLASANLVDWTGHKWATAFNEQAEILVGATAQELGELKEQNNDAYLEKIGEAAFKSYIFKLRLRQETYNDENRLKATVVSIQPINYKVYTEYLLKKIKELANIKN